MLIHSNAGNISDINICTLIMLQLSIIPVMLLGFILPSLPLSGGNCGGEPKAWSHSDVTMCSCWRPNLRRRS